MILYLSVIFIAMIVVASLNIALTDIDIWLAIVLVVGSTAFQFVVDGLFAIIVNKMPNRWFDKDKKCFQVSKKWQHFYEKLQIRKWKDKVWELGGLGGFRKNKLADPNSPVYIERFIIESNKGVVTHRIGYFVGFLAMIVVPFKYSLSIALPIVLVNLFLNILPTMVLRYNIPKLHVAYKRLTRNLKMKNTEN